MRPAETRKMRRGGGKEERGRYLAQSLEKHHAFNVTHRAAQFNHANVGHAMGGIDRNLGDPLYPRLHRVRDVGNQLHGFAQIVTFAFFADHMLIHFARGDVVIAGESQVQEPLVIAQIQVGLAAIIQHKRLTMLVRTHGAGVDVQIRINFDGRHAQTRVLEQQTWSGVEWW
jgi:hypothetical protein